MYLPKFQPQLGRGCDVPGRTQGSRDCGPRVWQMGIDAVTHGDVRAGVSGLRRRADAPCPEPTNVVDAKRAVESYDQLPDRRPLRYYIKRSTSEVRKAVRNGRFVHACIDYQTWNDLLDRTGDPNFDGGHSIGIYGQRKRNGKVQWFVWDPLDDARRPSIPMGPRWVARWKVIEAMEDFAWGAGKCYAGVFGGGQKR